MVEHRHVLLTGASSGFGLQTAKALARRGHTVFATMRGVGGKNAEQAESLSVWAREHAPTLRVLELDVTLERSVSAAIEQATAEGPLNVVINNAGVGAIGIDEGFSVAQAKQLFEVNLFGVMRVNRAVLPHLRARGEGLLLYVSSGFGRLVSPFMGIYSATKFALEAYAQSVSYEVAPLGIHSVIVEPGLFGTSAFANNARPERDVLEHYGPVARSLGAFSEGIDPDARRVGEPAEVARALVEEVERPPGPRPLRRPVGQDAQTGLVRINRVCDQVQAHILRSMGMGEDAERPQPVD